MRFDGRKLRSKGSCLIGANLLIVLAACASTKALRPHFLDTQLGELREFSRQGVSFKYLTNHELKLGADSYGNGFMCVPPEQAQRCE